VKGNHDRYYLVFLLFALLIHQHHHGSQHQLVEKPSMENQIVCFTCQIVNLPLLPVPTERGKMDSREVGDFPAIPVTGRSFLASGATDFPWKLFHLGASITERRRWRPFSSPLFLFALAVDY
jgi:hypothetical protein